MVRIVGANITEIGTIDIILYWELHPALRALRNSDVEEEEEVENSSINAHKIIILRVMRVS